MEDKEKLYHDFWFSLLKEAFQASSFDTLCILLRPRGMHMSGWDILDEAEVTFDDFNWMLEIANKQRGISSSRRLALHYYCFIIEMTPIHEIIANILGVISGSHYKPFPLMHLNHRKGKRSKTPGKQIPASLSAKISHIRNLAKELNKTELLSYIDTIFDESLRNSIAHSDYIITDKELRLFNAEEDRIRPIEEVDDLINLTFGFLSGLLVAYANMKFFLARNKKYHKWSNYEVLEILRNDNGLCGFSVHFSNGSKSTFRRDENGATAINMIIDDTVGFMVGLIDDMENKWKIDGKEVTDWDAINKD